MTDRDETRHIPSDKELAAAEAQFAALGGESGWADAALWIDPDARFEERLMAAVTPESGPESPEVVQLRDTATRRRRWWWPAAAAAAAVVAIAALAMRPTPPDWEVALAPTEHAPGVAATVLGWNETGGTRIELEIAGLAPAPAGFTYELWFSEGPIHVSAGTFHTPQDVTLWAGVTRADFPRLWITLEPLDDDPSPGLNLLDTET